MIVDKSSGFSEHDACSRLRKAAWPVCMDGQPCCSGCPASCTVRAQASLSLPISSLNLNTFHDLLTAAQTVESFELHTCQQSIFQLRVTHIVAKISRNNSSSHSEEPH